jgi:hypothetical protein
MLQILAVPIHTQERGRARGVRKPCFPGTETVTDTDLDTDTDMDADMDMDIDMAMDTDMHMDTCTITDTDNFFQ